MVFQYESDLFEYLGHLLDIGEPVKQADVKIGGTYYTYIGEQLTAVIVVSAQKDVRFGGKNVITRYRVRRPEQTEALPKLRSAAALREKNEKFF